HHTINCPIGKQSLWKRDQLISRRKTQSRRIQPKQHRVPRYLRLLARLRSRRSAWRRTAGILAIQERWRSLTPSLRAGEIALNFLTGVKRSSNFSHGSGRENWTIG